MGGLLTKELPLLELSNCAVATSGDLEQFLEIDGKRFSHIIDPTSGIGLRGRSQISLVAPNGITADSYASACLLLGPDGAPSLLKNLSFYKAYYLRAEKPDLECQLFEFHHPPID